MEISKLERASGFESPALSKLTPFARASRPSSGCSRGSGSDAVSIRLFDRAASL